MHTLQLGWSRDLSALVLSDSDLPSEQPPSSFQLWVLSDFNDFFFFLKITFPKRYQKQLGLAKPAYYKCFN